MAQKIHVVCSSCGQVNAVPPNRPILDGKCGACRTPLFPEGPAEVNDELFNAFITRSHLPVVVDFWAPWCGPCRAMAPQFSAAAKELAGRVHFIKLDTETHPNSAARYNIRSIPTMVLFRGGSEVARTSGSLQANQIKSWLHQNGV